MNIVLDIDDRATPRLAKRMALLARPRPILAAAGKAVEVALKEHFARKEAQPNKMGWPKTHFWGRRIRPATQLVRASDTEAVVSVSDPALAMRLRGGTIRPKEGKYLAIPARAEAYGRSPKTFDDLHFVPTGNGRGYLARNLQTSARIGKDGKVRRGGLSGGEAMYWLVRHVRQQADPSALPRHRDLEAAAARAALAALRRIAA